jgi:hypothetical protein
MRGDRAMLVLKILTVLMLLTLMLMYGFPEPDQIITMAE